MSYHATAIISFSLLSVVTMAEAIGDVSATTIAGLQREPTSAEIKGGIMADGTGSVLASIFGSLPVITYIQNVAVITLTGVVSRHVVTIGGLFLLLAGMIPKFGACLGSIPISVFGGGAILMFGLIVAAGLKMLTLVEYSRRNMLIIGLSLSIGIGLPAQSELLARLSEEVRVIFESGLVPAAILAIGLNLLLPTEESVIEE